MRRTTKNLLWFTVFAALAVFAVAQNDVADDDGVGVPDDDGDDDGVATTSTVTAAATVTDDDGADDDGDDDGLVVETKCARTHPRVGLVVELVDSADKNIGGTITIVDDCTLSIKGFTYDGTGKDAALVGSSTSEGLGNGFVFLDLPSGKVWDGIEVVSGELDDTVTWDDIVFISVWDGEAGQLGIANLEDGLFPSDDDDDGDGIDDDGVANNFDDDDDVNDDGGADDDGDGIDDDGVANNFDDDGEIDDDGDGVDDDGVADNFDDDGDFDDDGIADVDDDDGADN